jgi:quinol monooxygenase YgiN
MYARVTRFQFDPSRRDDATRITDQEVIPGMRQEQGFEHIYVLTDEETGEGMVVTLWADEASEQASRASMGQRFAKLGDIMTAPPSPTEIFEVASHS